MKHLITALVGAIGLGLLASTAGANDLISWGKISDQPIEIASHKATIRRTKTGGEITFQGNVKAKQADMTLNCDRLVLLFDEHKISGKKASGEELPKNLDTAQKFKSVTATGTVKVMQQDLKAVAGRAVFDGRTRTITLTENPRVWEGPRRMAADTFIIYPDENRAEALGKIKVTIDSAEQKKANENEQ